MHRAIAKRVSRLERGGGRDCPLCGRGRTVFKVVVPEATDVVAPAEPRPPRRCEVCGRAVAFWVTLPPARGG